MFSVAPDKIERHNKRLWQHPNQLEAREATTLVVRSQPKARVFNAFLHIQRRAKSGGAASKSCLIE